MMLCAIALMSTCAISQSQWSEVPLPFVAPSLEHISFIDSLHGCLVDRYQGILFYTADNGVTWAVDTIPAPHSIRKCTVVSDSTIWVWGDKGTSPGAAALMLSTDAGRTWARRDPPDTLQVRGMEFLSDSLVWLAGSSHLWVSNDGGVSWQQRGALFHMGSPVLPRSLECFDDSVGFIGGDMHSFPPQRTTDGGRTWEVFFIYPSVGGYGDACGPEQFAGDGLCSFTYHYASEATNEHFSGTVIGWNRLRDTLHVKTNPYNSGQWARAISREKVWLRDDYASHVLRRTTDGGNTWMRDTFAVGLSNALYDLRGHRFVLGSGRLFRLEEDPTGTGEGEFPLALNNAWYYRITYPSSYGPSTITYSTVQVTGDTVMPGGRHFRVLDRADLMGGRYIRCDSGVVSYWDTSAPAGEKRIVDLTAGQGERDTISMDGSHTLWNGYTSSVAGATYPMTVFGRPSVQRNFHFDGIVIGQLTFADGLGYSRYEFNGDSGDPVVIWELIGCTIDGVTYGTVLAVPTDQEGPLAFALAQNFPNPFNPSTTIGYAIPDRAFVTMTVCNTLGQQVAVLQSGIQDAGAHEVMFHASHLPSGLYFYRLQAGPYVATGKCLLVK